MTDVSPIRTEADHAAALDEIRRLWGAAPGSAQGDRLDVLSILVAAFEATDHPMQDPDPIEAVLVRMEDFGLDRGDLGEMLGVPSGRVSEILNRRRRLTVDMIRALAARLGLSERCLLQPYELVPVQRALVEA